MNMENMYNWQEIIQKNQERKRNKRTRTKKKKPQNKKHPRLSLSSATDLFYNTVMVGGLTDVPSLLIPHDA